MAASESVHEALGEYLEEDEIVVHWIAVIEVVGPDGARYLAHRSGGGHDGNQGPAVWTALGMLTASADAAREDLRESTREVDDD